MLEPVIYYAIYSSIENNESWNQRYIWKWLFSLLNLTTHSEFLYFYSLQLGALSFQKRDASTRGHKERSIELTIMYLFWTFHGFETKEKKTWMAVTLMDVDVVMIKKKLIFFFKEGMVDYVRNPVNSLKYLLLFPYQIVKSMKNYVKGNKEVEILSIQILAWNKGNIQWIVKER